MDSDKGVYIFLKSPKSGLGKMKKRRGYKLKQGKGKHVKSLFSISQPYLEKVQMPLASWHKNAAARARCRCENHDICRNHLGPSGQGGFCSYPETKSQYSIHSYHNSISWMFLRLNSVHLMEMLREQLSCSFLA